MADLCMEHGQFCTNEAETQPPLTEQKLYSNSTSGRVPNRQGALSTQALRTSRPSKTSSREWNWLASKFQEMRPQKHFNPRKGELPEELVRSIWRDDSDPTTAKVPIESLKKWAYEISNLTAVRKKREKRKDKIPTSIMDVLLQNWTYFNHAHSDVNNVHKHIHAKYCESEFGHFQLLTGRQVHVCYNAPVKSLVKELKGLLNRLRGQILQKGYQVEVAATHFDIISYSFDAWSFGTIENNRKYGTTLCTVKYMEPMQLKTTSSLEAAIRWTLKLQPYGGTSVIRALEEALSRTFADCIYFFTDGKPDRPVHVMEALKMAEKKRGYAIPMYTVGLCATGAGARFLTRISDATGGRYINADVKQILRPPEGEGEAFKDMIWAQSRIEAEQRRNAELGIQEDITEIIERVSSQFDEARQKPRIFAYEEKVRLARLEHESRVEDIRKQNAEMVIQAREAYDRMVQEISERNKRNREMVLDKWKEEVNRIQLKNKEMTEAMEKWKREVAEVERRIAEIREEAKYSFLRDLKEVEEKNRLKIEKSEEEHKLHVRRVRERNEFALAEFKRKENDLMEKAKALNKASQEEYDAAVAAVKASNKSLLDNSRADYEEKIAAIQEINIQRIRDAELAYAKRCEEIQLENARKQDALAKRQAEIKARREDAIAAHHAEVARTIREHEAKLKRYTELNAENEENARANWRRACQDIDVQNMAAAKLAMEDYDNQQKYVQSENLKLAQRRDEFQKRVREIEKCNAGLVKQKKAEWKVACSKIENEYYEKLAIKKEEHANLVEEISARNEAAMQAALLEHQTSIAAVEAYNAAIRPAVEASNAVLEEVHRVESFVTCIGDACLPDETPPNPTEKPRKRRLDNVLNLLSYSEKIVNTQMLIEALQVTYNLDKPDENADARNENNGDTKGPSNDKCLCNLLPIHPPRVVSHNCNASEDAKDPWLYNSSFL